jgi:hypothetical protein
LLIAALTALSPPASAGGIKCWVNKDEVRECGNVVPPEYAQKSHKEVSDQGITLSTTDRAKTKEELRKHRDEQRRLEEIEKEQIRLARERAAKDRVLLSTFTTEQDLLLAHDGQVAAIDVRIRHTNQIVKQLERSLEQLHAEAARLERSGKSLTPELEAKIDNMKQQIVESREFNDGRRQQKAELAAQFQLDLARYRELKGTTKRQ